MEKLGRWLFAIPWFVVALQHLIYADFVRTIVPAYMPLRMFWVYFTAAAMMAASVSLLTGIKTRLAARLLTAMMALFVLLVHSRLLSEEPGVMMHWTRLVQDLAIMGTASMLGGLPWLARTGKYLYALCLIFLGAEHFWAVAYVTGRTPDWLPPKILWDWIVGLVIMSCAACLFLAWKARQAATILGILLLTLILLSHLPHLVASPHDGGAWTAAMLECMIAAGAFILRSHPPGA